MEGVASVTQRIADIQARIASMSQLPGAQPASVASTTGTSPTSDFASLLADAQGENSLTPAASRPADGWGRIQPPAELAAYGNGKVPSDALTPIGVGSHRLYRPAAEAFSRMRSDAAAQGVTIGITDSYRDYAEQVDLVERKGRYADGGLAADPGTSNHGWGLATDLDLDDRALAWMRENGGRYGFVEDTPREPWHWGYRPAAST